jgi:hypothetical protein
MGGVGVAEEVFVEYFYAWEAGFGCCCKFGDKFVPMLTK